MGNIKSRALLYLYFVNLFIKKQSTPHHRDKQRKSRKRAVSNRPKKPILRQPLVMLEFVDLWKVYTKPVTAWKAIMMNPVATVIRSEVTKISM